MSDIFFISLRDFQADLLHVLCKIYKLSSTLMCKRLRDTYNELIYVLYQKKKTELLITNKGDKIKTKKEVAIWKTKYIASNYYHLRMFCFYKCFQYSGVEISLKQLSYLFIKTVQRHNFRNPAGNKHKKKKSINGYKWATSLSKIDTELSKFADHILDKNMKKRKEVFNIALTKMRLFLRIKRLVVLCPGLLILEKDMVNLLFLLFEDKFAEIIPVLLTAASVVYHFTIHQCSKSAAEKDFVFPTHKKKFTGLLFSWLLPEKNRHLYLNKKTNKLKVPEQFEAFLADNSKRISKYIHHCHITNGGY